MQRLRNDYHIHTYLAGCCKEKETQRPPNIVAKAEALGFDSIGFTEHYWDDGRATIRQLQADLAEIESPLRVFMGCEADSVGGGEPTITREEIDELGLDFVVLATSHFHLGRVNKPEKTDPRSAGEHWLKFLRGGINSGVADIIAHPVLNLSNALGDLDRIMDTMADAEIVEVLEMARERDIAMDMNPRLFTKDIWSADTQVRFYQLCKQVGVKISPASDAHSLTNIGDTLQLKPWADRIGLVNEDFIDADWIAARRQ